MRWGGGVRAAVLTWLVAACCAGTAHATAGAARDACTALDGYPTTAPRDPPTRNELVVPVVIHLMRSDVPPPPGWRQPDDMWLPAAVEQFFGSSTTPGLINQLVWNAVGVRVAVTRVETCRYSSTAFRDHGDERMASVPNPDEGQDATALYYRINAAFNEYDARSNRALDVYFWVKVGERSLASAYATSLRRQTAAVWSDAFCPMPRFMRAETCALKLAHEIGHALTLTHVCKAAGIGPNHPDAGIPIECDAPAEPRGSRVNLMRAVEQGRKLTEQQAAQARAWARQYYGVGSSR